MSISNISPISSVPQKASIETPLQTAIKKLIQEMQEQWEHHFPYPIQESALSTVKGYLLECLRLANGDEAALAQIKQALDTDKFAAGYSLISAIDQNYSEYALLLINLKVDAINSVMEFGQEFEYETPIMRAAKKHADKLFEALLKNGAVPLKNVLEYVMLDNDSEKVRLLIKAGANPNEHYNSSITTPFEKAVLSDDLFLVAEFLDHPKVAPDIEGAIVKLEMQELINLHEREEVSKIVAQALGPLPVSNGKARCFTEYASPEMRTLYVKEFLDPFFSSPPAIQPLLSPLAKFVGKETEIDSSFSFFFLQDRPNSPYGRYDLETGNIRVYLPSITKIKAHPEDYSVATLFHEVTHKAAHKLHWDERYQNISQDSEYERAALQDIENLKSADWKNCHSLTKESLSGVAQGYSPQKRFWEYLARVPEIAVSLASWHPDWTAKEIESVLEKDIPHLFQIYKEHFLPELTAYLAKE